MITDIRLDVGFPGHKKTLRLIRRLSDPAAPWLLVKLWIYVAQQLPDGVLRGMDDDDIEAVAGWNGEPGLFAGALRDSGYIDVDGDGVMVCHDWLDHNPWVAGSGDRSGANRFTRLAQVAPNVYSELKRLGVKSLDKKDYELVKKAELAGKPLADIINNLANVGERQRTASETPAPVPVPVPVPIPKPSLAAASSQEIATPTPLAPNERQQQKAVAVFADSEKQIRAAFKARHDFLASHFPHLNLAVEEEQCAAKYRGQPITTDAAVLVLEWCKRVSVGKQPDVRSRDRPDDAAAVLVDNDRVCAVFCSNDADKRVFCDVLIRLAKRLKSRGGLPMALTEDLLADWFDSLHPLGFERIAWAARHLIDNQVFFPALAEFRDAVFQAPRSIAPVVMQAAAKQPRAENGAQELADILANLDASDRVNMGVQA